MHFVCKKLHKIEKNVAFYDVVRYNIHGCIRREG